MPRFAAEMELVTPFFLGGVDPRGAPELRLASMRGVLRFWLRSLLGAQLGDDPSRVVRSESRVFGSRDLASPVIVCLNKPCQLRYLPSAKDALLQFRWRPAWKHHASFLDVVEQSCPGRRAINSLALSPLWLLPVD